MDPDEPVPAVEVGNGGIAPVTFEIALTNGFAEFVAALGARVLAVVGKLGRVSGNSSIEVSEGDGLIRVVSGGDRLRSGFSVSRETSLNHTTRHPRR